jgi:hypothetical protein
VPLARVTLTGPGVHEVDFTNGSGDFEFLPTGRPDDVLKVTATHFVLEYKPVNENVRVMRRVFSNHLLACRHHGHRACRATRNTVDAPQVRERSIVRDLGES